MQSWQQGTRQGSLCERNWQVVIEARQHARDEKGLALSRKRLAECSAPVKSP
jgi:general secretion pathway protein D